MTQRFTIDGSDQLEACLEHLCQRMLAGLQVLLPSSRLTALVLGGGYGRGQGGVLKTDAGDRPYNDLEFYVFLCGQRLWNERQCQPALRGLGERLSAEAGLHVEFKIESLNRLRHSPVSMFSYDLVAGHRIVYGPQDVFRGCEHHLQAESIPRSEATRLLFNRCTGLLLARELLDQAQLTAEQADFVGRNLAKARLALGDALLAASGSYHWSCLERQRRLRQLSSAEALPWLEEVREQHQAGVEFKLHPIRLLKPLEEFRQEHRAMSALASRLWLWLESRRLNCAFASLREYAFSRLEKCSETSRWRNYLLNLKTFGPRAALDPMAWRYPRERLLNALPLLLWNGEIAAEPQVARHLKRQLHTGASDWTGLVAAYKQVWPSYG